MMNTEEQEQNQDKSCQDQTARDTTAQRQIPVSTDPSTVHAHMSLTQNVSGPTGSSVSGDRISAEEGPLDNHLYKK